MADNNDDVLPSLEIPELEQEIKKEEQYGGRPIEAFATSAANSALLGFGDAALTALGMPAERIKEVREREPDPATLGTATGIIVPAIATFGTSTAARAVAAPIRAIDALGAATQAGVKQLIPKAGAAQTIASAAARGAVEGAAVGTGQLTSDVALGNRDLSAESIAATVGMGALYGKGFGTLLGTAQATVPAALGKIAKTARGAGRIVTEGIDPLIDENQIAARTVTHSNKAAFDLTAKLGDDAKSLGTYLKDDLNFSLTETPKTLIEKNNTKLSQVATELKDITEQLDATVKAGVGPAPTRKELYQPLLDKIDELAESAKVNPNLTPNKMQLKQLEGFREDILRKMNLVRKTERFGRKSAERAAIEAEETALNQELAELKKKPKVDDATYELIKRQSALEQELDTLTSQVKTAEPQIGVQRVTKDGVPVIKAVATSKEAITNRINAITRELQDVRRISGLTVSPYTREKQIRQYLSELASAKKYGKYEPVPASMREYNDLRKQYQEIAYPRDGELSQKIDATIAEELRNVQRKEIDRIADLYKDTIPNIDTRLRTANKQYHIGKTIQRTLDKAVRNAPDISSPAQFAFSAAGRIARNAALVGDIGAKTLSVKQTIAKEVDSAFARATRRSAITFPATNLIVNSNFALDEQGRKPKNKQQALDNIQNNIATVRNNPEAMVDLLAKKTTRISNASPEVGYALQERLSVGLEFLHSKLPRPSLNEGAFARKYQPSTLEMAKFERYLQIVEQPLSALQELKNGTLTREHVEALKVVFPEIYRQMQVDILRNINAGSVDMPYEKKIQIGILLGVPADSSLTSESVIQLQQSISGVPAEQAQPVTAQPTQVRAKGIDSADLSGRMQSGVEKVQTRE